jgi:hypothetical protein
MTLGHACMQKEAAHSAGAMQRNEPKTELIMSRFTPIQTNGVTPELKRGLKNRAETRANDSNNAEPMRKRLKKVINVIKRQSPDGREDDENTSRFVD